METSLLTIMTAMRGSTAGGTSRHRARHGLSFGETACCVISTLQDADVGAARRWRCRSRQPRWARGSSHQAVCCHSR